MRRLAVAAMLAALVGAYPAEADDSPIASSSERIGGRDLASWFLAWNRWRFALPDKPAGDDKGCFTRNQPGPVWFLSGGGSSIDGHVVSIDCTVPAGSYLLSGLPETVCTDVLPTDDQPDADRGLDRCARTSWRSEGDPAPRLVLDGRAIPPGFVVSTPVFRFTMPARSNIFGTTGVRRGRAASAGRVALIKPLDPGRHTLIQGIKYRSYHNLAIVYNLDVV